MRHLSFTNALEWVGPVAAIGLGVAILVATVPRWRTEEAGIATDDEPMGDGGEA
jgi:cytochrome c-type biogenesis protein CcmH/NrfF